MANFYYALLVALLVAAANVEITVAQDTTAAAAETTTAAPETTTAAPETTTAAPETTTAAPETTTAAPETTTAAPATTTAAPETTTEATTAAPETTTAAPETTTAAPETTTAAPETTTAAPETTTAAPETTTAAPETTTAAPETTTAAPETTTAAPETTTAAPETTTAAPETTTAAPETTTEAPSPMDDGGLSVKCTRDYMRVTLDASKHPGLKMDGMVLEDTSCIPEGSNDTHVTFKTGLDGCGTKHNTTDKYIIYYNAIVANTKVSNDSSIITRDFQASFPFQCSFPRRKVLSVTSFSPRRKVVYTKAAEFGNFTFVMDMYKTDKYEDIVDAYPHEVNLGTPMYIRMEVKSKDSKLVLFVKNAKATPSPNYNDNTSYQFIVDGCGKDPTLLYFYDKQSPIQNFSIDAFRFLDANSDEIYIHAELEVCRSNDPDSVCAKGCQETRRRRRAIAGAPGALLYVGPLQVSQAKSAASTTGTSVGTIGTVAASFGALVLILIVVLAVIIVRRRASQTPSPKVVFSKATTEETNRLV